MANLATLEVVKDLLEQWSDEALTLDARAHRYPDEDASERDVARANAFRECIEDLDAMFPEAKAWHAEGVVPAATDDLEPLVRQLVEDWRAGKLDGSKGMHDLWEALEPGVPNNDQAGPEPAEGDPTL